jgi:nitroreductase
MYDLEEAITERRSTRLFLRDEPVPREPVNEALELAMRAPSNSNVQPWHVLFTSGHIRSGLSTRRSSRSARKTARRPMWCAGS